MRFDYSDTYVRAAASDLLTIGLDALTRWLQDRVETDPFPIVADDEDARAAALLNIDLDASADEIRAALRARIVGHHPDQGGDGLRARELVAAQNRLLARAKDRWFTVGEAVF